MKNNSTANASSEATDTISMAESEKPKVSTAGLVPWIPPGKPKESTFNAYAHKKNQGIYDFGESTTAESGFWPAVKKGSVNYKFFEPKLPKRSIQSLNGGKRSLDITKQRRIDSLLNAEHNSDAEREYLRKKILEIFQESDEGKNIIKELDKDVDDEESNNKNKKNKKRRNSEPGKDDSKDGDKNGRSQSYDGDERSEPYTPEDGSANKKGRRHSDEGYNSDSDKKKRGRPPKKRISKSANTETDDDVDDRNSVEFIDYDANIDTTKNKNNQNQNGFGQGQLNNQGQNFPLNQNIPGFQFPDQQFPGQQIPGQQFPGQQFPGQQFPGQQFVGQSYYHQYQGTNFPGQNLPGQNFPAQNIPGQNYGGQNFQGTGFTGQSFNSQQYPGPRQGTNFPGQVPNFNGVDGYNSHSYQGYNYGNQASQLNSLEDPRLLGARSTLHGKQSQLEGGYYDSGDDYFLSPSPAGFQSIQLDRSRQSRLSLRGPNGPNEAWVIFPKNGESPKRANASVMTYTAKPLNLASSIGGKLKQSFAQINRSSTPINSTSGSIDPLVTEQTEEDKEAAKKKKKRKNALIAGGAACCATIILASIILLAVLFITLSGNSSNVGTTDGTDYFSGYGNNNDTRPCQVYTSLNEAWRRIVGYGPSNSGGGYNCDMPRFSQVHWKMFQTLLFATLVEHFIQQNVASASRIVVAAGSDVTGLLLNNVEVIDISAQPKTCQNLPALPIALESAQGALGLNNLPTVCGGKDPLKTSSTCFTFENGMWKNSSTLKNGRSKFAMTPLSLNNGPNQLFITGGYNDNGPLASTEYLSTGGEWVTYTPLPAKIYEHCIINANNYTFAVIGGIPDSITADGTYVITAENPNWTTGPNFNLQYPRSAHKCALINKSGQGNEKSIIVVGGFLFSSGITTSVEIFNIEKMAWEKGPDFPTTINSGSLVTDTDGGVLYIGGKTASFYPTTIGSIYRLAHAGANWVLLPQTLKTARYNHVSFVVKDEITTCN